MMAVSAIVSISSCQKNGPENGQENGGGQETAAPKIVWESNPDFETVNIDDNLDATLSIIAPGKIKSLVVGIDSDLLEPILSAMQVPAEFDLVSNTEVGTILDGLTQGALPTGEDLLDKEEVEFNITALVKLIAGIATETGDHSFSIKVTDGNDKSVSAVCTFRYLLVSATVEVKDINLWTNTATVSVASENAMEVSVWFGEKGSELRQLEGTDGSYPIAAEYTEGTNDAGFKIYTPVAGTGVYAATTYVVEVRNGETVIGEKEFTTESGDVIPNGDMSGWSKKDWLNGGKAWKITYPNTDGESFWDSGNNAFLEQYDEETGEATLFTPLCQEDEGVAMLSAQTVLGFVFAPGNMYTGDFDYSGFSGTANFGKVFDWTARPVALKVSYKANVGLIDKVGTNDPDGESFNGKQDVSRIYAVVIDWSKQHGVVSGMTTPTGMWDPSTATSLDEGAILGYAILDITANQEEFTDAEIPFVWYDTVKKPAEGNYSIVISCATSKRGDYLTGCSTNKLWVDNFKFVY